MFPQDNSSNIFRHNLKKGCERCHVRGEYHNRMIFEDINSPNRIYE